MFLCQVCVSTIKCLLWALTTRLPGILSFSCIHRQFNRKLRQVESEFDFRCEISLPCHRDYGDLELSRRLWQLLRWTVFSSKPNTAGTPLGPVLIVVSGECYLIWEFILAWATNIESRAPKCYAFVTYYKGGKLNWFISRYPSRKLESVNFFLQITTYKKNNSFEVLLRNFCLVR